MGEAAQNTKVCPLCGEQILAVAIRCKHCQADLSKSAVVPAAAVGTGTGDGFDGRFLDWAFKTDRPINAASVAHGLKITIAQASDALEDLAARDVIIREVDGRGTVFYQLPGRSGDGAHVAAAVLQKQAVETVVVVRPNNGVLALLLNILLLPGVGSLVAGRTTAGVIQLCLFVVGIPLAFVGIGVPMIIAAWVWALVTGIQALNDTKQ